jgi:hypothetical protein
MKCTPTRCDLTGEHDYALEYVCRVCGHGLDSRDVECVRRELDEARAKIEKMLPVVEQALGWDWLMVASLGSVPAYKESCKSMGAAVAAYREGLRVGADEVRP